MPVNLKKKINGKSGFLKRLGLFIGPRKRKNISHKKAPDLTELITKHAMRKRAQIRKQKGRIGFFKDKDAGQEVAIPKVKKPQRRR